MWFSVILINILNITCIVIVDTLALTAPIKNIGRSSNSNNNMMIREAESLLVNKEIKLLGIKGDEQKEENALSHSISIHLVSLPEYSDIGPRSLRDIWKWKDISLGDGRDFFVPRPRAIRDLTALILKQDNGSNNNNNNNNNTLLFGYKVKECAILSNCARLDVYIAMTMEEHEHHSNSPRVTASLAAKLAVSRILASQITSFQSKPDTNIALKGMTAFLDLPGFIDMNVEQASPDNELVQEIAHALKETHDITNITYHSCLIACGMANRPRRPVREVIFRPFSARDAHIMLQLKRTVECATGPHIITILNTALQAGKASRDPNTIPEINLLTDYASTGKYAPMPPKHIVNTTYHAVMQKAIQPAIQRCILKIVAMQASASIQLLQQNVQDLFAEQGFLWNTTHGKIAKSLLHQPIQNLRLQKPIDMNGTIQLINHTILEHIENDA